jgi:GT2 family glycosyltransferase
VLPEIEPREQFIFKAEYRLIEADNRQYVQDTVTGARIETDELGRSILSSSPLSLASALDTLNRSGLYLSSRLIRFYLLLFWKAGVIEKHSSEIPSQASPGGELTDAVTAPVSVVIVTYNGERFLRSNLESLYRQTMAPAEIIIVDNASTDNTLKIAAEEFKDVRIIKNSKNYHYAKAVNIGVEHAVSPQVLILNQDIVLEADCIRRLYRRYEKEQKKENLAGIVPQIRFNKQRYFINGIGNFVTEKNWGSDNYFGAVDIGQFANLNEVGSACFGAILVTKRGWSEVGPLDERYKSFYEDTDWSLRVHLRGFKLLAAPKAIVYHEFGGSYPSGIKLFFIIKNRMRFALKNLGGAIRRRFITQYLKQDLRNLLAFLRGKSFKNLGYFFKAYLYILLELPGIIVRSPGSKKAARAKAEDFFRKGTPFVVLSNKRLEPVINKEVIRKYYYFCGIENFKFPEEPLVY